MKKAEPKVYSGENRARIAFPLGGIGAGMVCLEGAGALSHVSLRHRPEVFNEPLMFSALYAAGASTARVLEGPVPQWKAFGAPGSGNGGGGKNYGLPRFSGAKFQAQFPFAHVELIEPSMPVRAVLTGWSPFIPADADSSSLPVFALEYNFENISGASQDFVFSFHSANFMRPDTKSDASVRGLEGGFVLSSPAAPDRPEAEGHFAALIDDPLARSDCAWFRGGWFDAVTMLWRTVQEGGAPARKPHEDGAPGGGASVYLPFRLEPGVTKQVRVLACWYVPRSDLRCGSDPDGGGRACCDAQAPQTHVPWYAGRFSGIDEVAEFWRCNYDRLRAESEAFSACFYDTTLPQEAVESVAANLTILKSPTCLRQPDGRFWAWEGCCDGSGCCHGSCTHVWNYAQALPHLFPQLERSLRETEFFVSQDERGHQHFRTNLPIRPVGHDFHAAADGQLGGIMKVYREWRISGDTAWLRNLWLRVRQSLLYCIETWDPDRRGVLVEPHHNTYDIEFWGPDAMCSSFYLGALSAAVIMGRECGENVSEFEALLERGAEYISSKLWNGEYFVQDVQWQGLRAGDPAENPPAIRGNYSPEAVELLRKEGPKYQYGGGCLSDGVLGDWIARCCGLGGILDPEKVGKHLASVFRYNFRPDLSAHSNTQRPTFAFGNDGGLLLCSWPKGGKPSLPFVYSDEVWTGIEYQAASHLIMNGMVEEGLHIVKAVRDRYDGRYRNPFNEYECGHWYARAMASYGLLQALSGARYDAVDKVLYLDPAVEGDFRSFLATATGYGTVGMRDGKPFIEVVSGQIEVREIRS